MRLAIDEARRGVGYTTPNPAVGAVLVRRGKVIATGYHEAAGRDHGEVAALRKVGFEAKGCELYTTLEPCNHTGRTGPCTEAIIGSGVARVIVGALDPNPIVAGKGVRRLRREGIEVVTGVLADDCAALNEAYNHAIVEERPFVVLKAAQSLDGRVATRTGESKWITGEEARCRARAMRAEADGIVVGVGTVLADDPALTARIEGAHDPVRIVLDTSLRIPPTSKIVRTARAVRTVVVAAKDAAVRRAAALDRRGVEVVLVKKRGGGVDLRAMLDAVFRMELNGILVEGGPTVHGAFLDHGLVEKVVVFVAPMVIGGGLGAFGERGARRLSDALHLERVSIERAGADFVVTGYPRSRFARRPNLR